MSKNFDFNSRYKFKLSRSNQLDLDAHVIDENLNTILSSLNEDNDNIDLSSFKPQKELNPKVWVNDKINSKVRLRLLDIADDFIDTLPIGYSDVEDIILTGSMANYNWSKYSDFDLHIMVDFSKIDKRTEILKDYFNTKKSEWNNKHGELKIYGFPVEVYVQDINEEHCSSGVYSLNKNKWIVKPEAGNIKAIMLDKFFIKSKTLKFIKLISELESQLQNEADEVKLDKLAKKVKKTFDTIKGLRKEGLKKSGEMSPYNVIFKLLRRLGYMSKLLDMKDKCYDRYRSIT